MSTCFAKLLKYFAPVIKKDGKDSGLKYYQSLTAEEAEFWPTQWQ
jgi:hypothetical protein